MIMIWGDILAIFVLVVVVSFVAGAVDAWREQRKWDKTEGGVKTLVGWTVVIVALVGLVGLAIFLWKRCKE